MREVIQRLLEDVAQLGHTAEKTEEGWHITGLDSEGNLLEINAGRQKITTLIQPPKETETSYQYYITIDNEGRQVAITRNYTHTSFCGDPRGPSCPVSEQALSNLANNGNLLWQNVGDLLTGKSEFLPELAILKVTGENNFSINNCFQAVSSQ